MDHIIVDHQGIVNYIWLIGWLFTIGFLRTSFFKGLLGIIIWPFYLGSYARKQWYKEPAIKD